MTGSGFPEPVTRAIHYFPWNCPMIYCRSTRGFARQASLVGWRDTYSCDTSASSSCRSRRQRFLVRPCPTELRLVSALWLG